MPQFIRFLLRIDKYSPLFEFKLMIELIYRLKYKIMNLKLFLLGVLVSGAFSSQTCFAQQSEKKSDWYFGVGGEFVPLM